MRDLENRERKTPQEIRISVRGLVEFVLRHGDIDNRHKASPDNAMQEGGRIHRKIQRRMGAEYQAEVPLKYTLPTNDYILVVEGRADGIIQQEGAVTIDEIKGTYRDLARLQAPAPLHMAQAKCYAYIYGLQQELKEVQIRLTYCNMTTEELRYFHESYTIEELEAWFGEVLAAYRKWADFSWKWHITRQESIKGLEFPFPYRQGQKELAADVYRTIYHQKKLFLEAPTGVGKTVTTLYPSIQALGKELGERIFYLTAKTITRTVADDTLSLFRAKGLRIKSIILTAKEKICFMEETECNPEYCPYAKGHFDRVNEAVFALLTEQDRFSRERIEEFAQRYRVCPFEMSLDLSLYADVIICDYNYLFDPHVYLKRFFSDTEKNYIFLVDEAHNLLERGREMYSAVLWKEQFAELRRILKKTVVSETGKRRRKSRVFGQITLEMTQNMTLESENDEPPSGETEDIDQYSTEAGATDKSTGKRRGGKSVLVKQGYADKMLYQLEKCNKVLLAMKRECEKWNLLENLDDLAQHFMRLHAVIEDYFAQQETGVLPVGDQLLDFYFELRHFLYIYDLLDENYVKYTQTNEDGSFMVKLFCVNPHENLKNCMLRGRSTVLFSATFLPIQYYKALLGGEAEDYEVYAQSVFNPAKRALFIAGDVTSKYTRRSEDEYYKIALYIEEVVKNRHGNYMVFFPSYAFMNIVYQKYVENFGGRERECILQGEAMDEEAREAFLDFFRGVPIEKEGKSREGSGEASGGEPGSGTEGTDRILIGFCILGGIFSEGIDLKKDSLIGAIIVGTGLPQVSQEKTILKEYFDNYEEAGAGFDYAFRYPGMNKVLQAAGRVIRTVDDVGIIVLLDERFLQYSYRRLFPREWESFETVTVNTVAKRVERFWDEWL